MNYYPFHIGDYLSATRHLTWAEDAAFRRLLDVYYTTEKPLPTELRAVYRLVVASNDEQREAVENVLNEFFVQTSMGWVNNRADGEIDAMRDKQQKQRDKANKRWHKPETEPGNAPAMPRHENADATASKTDADAMPPTPTPTPTPTPVLKEKKSASAPTIPEIPESLMADFQKIRRSKKAPLTDTAINGLRREAEKAGVTMTEAITACCEFGWQGFNADWYAERTASKTATAGNPPTESFAERDARTKRENWEVMTNRKWPEQDLPQSARSSAIDAAAFELPNNIRRLAQ